MDGIFLLPVTDDADRQTKKPPLPNISNIGFRKQHCRASQRRPGWGHPSNRQLGRLYPQPLSVDTRYFATSKDGRLFCLIKRHVVVLGEGDLQLSQCGILSRGLGDGGFRCVRAEGRDALIGKEVGYVSVDNGFVSPGGSY